MCHQHLLSFQDPNLQNKNQDKFFNIKLDSQALHQVLINSCIKVMQNENVDTITN